jgi:hypothetical protein
MLTVGKVLGRAGGGEAEELVGRELPGAGAGDGDGMS